MGFFVLYFEQTWNITLRPRQNGRQFSDHIFKCIFLNKKICIAPTISLTFVPKGPINSIPTLVQIMVWRRPAANHYLNQWWLIYWRIYASLDLNVISYLNDYHRRIGVNSTLQAQGILWYSVSHLTHVWSVKTKSKYLITIGTFKQESCLNYQSAPCHHQFLENMSK